MMEKKKKKMMRGMVNMMRSNWTLRLLTAVVFAISLTLLPIYLYKSYADVILPNL